MSDDPAIRIAKALAAEVNTEEQAGNYSVSGFKAKYVEIDHDEQISDLGEVRVDVVLASAEDVELDNQYELARIVRVHVVIRKRFTKDEYEQQGRLKTERINRLITLVQEIGKQIAKSKETGVLADEDGAVWDGGYRVVRRSMEKLRKGIFEGYVEIPFTFCESIA